MGTKGTGGNSRTESIEFTSGTGGYWVPGRSTTFTKCPLKKPAFSRIKEYNNGNMNKNNNN